MPEQLKASEVNSQSDPSVAKQYDTTTPIHEQFTDFYSMADGLSVALLTTHRPKIGMVARSMAIAKRVGPDFLFLANTHSQKFTDLQHSKDVAVTIQNSTGNQDWASVSGLATVVSNSDPRIAQVWSKAAKAWFGDLGDGVHTGGPEDPRMALIEVRARHIVYYKATKGMVGYLKETTMANITGGVAQTGLLRELGEEEIEKARAMA